MEAVIKAYNFEAIEVEKACLKVKLKKTSEFKIPIKFQSNLNKNAPLKKAFKAFTQ